MKNNSKSPSGFIKSIVIVFALIYTANINALGLPPPPGLPHDSVPLDGGLTILAIGAAIFGVKKLRENKK